MRISDWSSDVCSSDLPNARHCMASAVVGFMRTFGIDEPMGCYDDIEHADAFMLWGSNMAEMHPILWSRITDRRLTQARKSVGSGKSVSVRVDLGGCRIIKKKKDKKI